MNIGTELRQRLQAGKWRLERHKKHEIWTLPDGQRMVLGTTLRDTYRKKANYIRSIERMEEAYMNSLQMASPEIALSSVIKTLAPPPPVQPNTMGRWLQQTRLEENLSTTQVADLMSAFGWNTKTVQNLECATRKFDELEWAAWIGITGKPVPANVRINYSPRRRPAPPVEPVAVAPAPIPTPEPVVAPAAPTARESAIKRATRLLSNSRITDLEASRLVDALQTDLTKLLLGGL